MTSEPSFWQEVIRFIPKVASKFPITLSMVVVSLILGVLLGIALAFINYFKVPVLHQLAVVFISFIRGTPEIVQIFIVYYGVPPLVESVSGVVLGNDSSIALVTLAFSLNVSAYLAELFRGALQSVPVGQLEAGVVCGLTRSQVFRRIIIPQAARYALPTFGVLVVLQFQGTALASTVGVMDMLGKAVALGNATYRVLEGYVAAAVIFVAISLLLTALFQWLDRRLTYGGSGVRR